MSYAEKLYKAMMLDVEFYESVEADKSLTKQALITVALVSIVNGLMVAGIAAPIALAQGVLGSVVRWIIWAFLLHL